MGSATAHFCPALWGTWGGGGGAKGQLLLTIIKFQLLSQFQRSLKQTLCVYSQMKDIKQIRRDFHSAAWFMAQGWDFGVWWVVGGCQNFFSPKFNQSWCVSYMNDTCNGTIIWVPPPPPPHGALGRGQKVKYN